MHYALFQDQVTLVIFNFVKIKLKDMFLEDRFYKIISRIVWLFLFFGFVSCQSSKEKSTPPNIILIMADDLGFECLESYGGTSYKTPNLNNLAQTGMQFNNAYAQPLCTPTRVELMTGKYNFRNWKAFGILDPNSKTIGHFMQEAGYATCIAGKWQLQSYDTIGYPGANQRRGAGMKVEDAGFDEYCLWHTGHQEDKGSRYPNPKILQNGDFLENTKDKYGPDIFSDFLNDFVNKQDGKPFFVYYPMALTHDPFSPSPDDENWADENKRTENNPKHFEPMVEYMDKVIGKIVKNLDEKGLREETLILFYSDNGTHQKITSTFNGSSVKGGKGLTTQSGIKVPCIANWKGKIKENTTTDDYVSAVDFLPTLLDAAGVSANEVTQTDGQSFLPELKAESSKRRDWVYIGYNPRPGIGKEHFDLQEFVFNSTYKLYSDGRLFNTKNDVLEKSPLDIKAIGAAEKSLVLKFENILDSLNKYPPYGYVERLDPTLDEVISKHAKLELVARGFSWSEGPVWLPKEQKLLFSDVPENKVYQWSEADGLSVYITPSGYTGSVARSGGKGSNGLALDKEDNLLLCQHGDRVISKLVSKKDDGANPVFQPFITGYNGKKFNSPNDLMVDKEGNIYFTDPPYGLPAGDPGEMGIYGVYFFSSAGKIKLVDGDMAKPNGVVVSHDGKTLYVAESNIPRPIIWAYDIVNPGVVSNKRIFFDPGELINKSLFKQNPDGIKLDRNGNIFVAAADGILIINPQGKHIGTINTGRLTGNCEFTEDYKYLFITADNYLIRVELNPEL